MGNREEKISDKAEEYLEAIYRLEKEPVPPRPWSL